MNPPNFLTDYKTVLQRVRDIHPIKYQKSRNFIDGEVSYLSPFITHGIINTKQVFDLVTTKYGIKASEKLISELGWREFFHRVWESKEDEIFTDLRFEQSGVEHEDIPTFLETHTSSINVIDTALKKLKNTGYIHNHERMWIASVVGNIGKTHWLKPAQWLYYHLLDGDLASNSLSWQWVVGTFSSKKYYANQQNLNTFSGTKQTKTFLDTSYEQLPLIDVPPNLKSRTNLSFSNTFPISERSGLTSSENKVLLHSIWNLDPTWHQDKPYTRILWIQPSLFKRFPMSPKRWEFITHWAKQINGLQIFVGEWKDLFPEGIEQKTIISQKYPLIKNWPGTQEPRPWLFNTSGYFKNFFSYWKKAKKEIGL